MTEVFGGFRNCLAAECIEQHVIPRLRSSRGNPFPTGGSSVGAKGSPCRGAAERSEAEGFTVVSRTPCYIRSANPSTADAVPLPYRGGIFVDEPQKIAGGLSTPGCAIRLVYIGLNQVDNIFKIDISLAECNLPICKRKTNKLIIGTIFCEIFVGVLTIGLNISLHHSFVVL